MLKDTIVKSFMKKCALVTGAAKRLGKEIALFLAGLGYDIALHYNSSVKEALKTKSLIQKSNVRCELFKTDISSLKAVSKLIQNAYGKFPNLGLIVNSASIFERALISETTSELLERHFAINFAAPFILSRDFAKICKNGQIINILDTRIKSNRPTYAAYSLSKKALFEFTKMSAVEFAPKIRVNAIAPGLILPPEDKSYDYLDRLAKNIPLKRRGSVKNILSSLKFLIENDFVTGQVIFCDGGEHLLWK